MKPIFKKCACFVLATTVCCGALFLTSCDAIDNIIVETTTVNENPVETTTPEETTTITPDVIPGDDTEEPEIITTGLFVHGSDELIYSWNDLIFQGLITIKDRSITKVSNSLNGDIKIPDDVISISKNAFSGCTGISGVYVGSNVTYIGDSAFSGCSGIEVLEIGNGVTKIGNSAFKNCTGLRTLIIGDRVTSIEANAFQGCTDLKYAIISDRVTFIGKNAFDGCTGLKVVYVGKRVTNIGSYVFNNCTALTDIIIPRSVSFIGANAFSNCNVLETIRYGGYSEEFFLITIEKNNAAFEKLNATYDVDMREAKEDLKLDIEKLLLVEVENPEVEETPENPGVSENQ